MKIMIIGATGKQGPQLLHKESIIFLANLLSGRENRLLLVGGAGSLYTDKTHTQRLMDTPDFNADGERTGLFYGIKIDCLKINNYNK